MEKADETSAAKCPSCKKIVTDDHCAIGCEVCDNWFHIECVGIPENVYEFISSTESSGGFIWNCDICRKNKPTSNSQIRKTVHREIQEVLLIIIRNVIEVTDKCSNFMRILWQFYEML